MTMPRMCVLVGICLACLLGAAPAGQDAPDPFKEELARIESAYRAGMAAASTPAERLDCLRLRRGALEALAERAYQATLAWLAERDDLLDAVQADQARWQSVRDTLDRPGPGGEPGREALELSSTLLLERLRLLASITSKAAFGEENL